jgi:hypothetical protein
MNRQTAKRIIVYVTGLTVLTLGFTDNVWNVSDSHTFEHFAAQTESFIVGRLARSEQDGPFSDGGLTGRETDVPEGKNAFTYQYEIYYNDIPIKRYLPYESNSAIQGVVLSVLDRFLGFPPATRLKIYRLIAAIVSACVLSSFLLWVLDVFGLVSALLSLLLMALSPWLTIAGGHLYWIFGTIYLPFLVPLVLLHREYWGRRLSTRTWFIGVALAIFLKCLITGYEFISATLVMMTMPVFFYALWHRWSPRLFVQRLVTASLSGLVGTIACALVLTTQIAKVEGSMQKGWEHIEERLLLRTYPPGEVSGQQTIPQRISDTNDVPLTTVIETYLQADALSAPMGNGHYSLSFGILLLGFAGISAVVFVTSRNPALIALATTTWISIMAPLSWFIIFKSHSVLHPFLDPLVWYMPMFLMMFTFVSSLKQWSNESIPQSRELC